MDINWAFKEGEQLDENKGEYMWLEANIVIKNEEGLVVEFLLHTSFREKKKQYQTISSIPNSKYTELDFEGETHYLLGHNFAYELGITGYLDDEFAEKVLEKNLLNMKQKLIKGLPVFDSREAYEKEVENGKILMETKDLKRFGYETEEMKIAGYLLSEAKYNPLYDVTDKVIFYPKKPKNAEPLRVFKQFHLTPKENEFVGYFFQFNSFTHNTIEPLYDLEKALERKGLKKYKKSEYEKSFIETSELSEEFVEKNADKIVGYRKGSTYYYPIINVKTRT